METWIPDGEYEVDFTGLFKAHNGDFFGMKYGFKPDTIDETQPSQLYIDDEQWYLVTKSKASRKSISMNNNLKDIYFEGKCTQSITPLNLQHQETPGLNIFDQNSTTHGNELLLSFDPVSSSFKANPIVKFVKMIKSPEPEKIQRKISELKKQGSLKSSLFLNKVIERINKQNIVNKSPIKMADHVKILRKEALPPNSEILNKLSPVRRNPATFPVASPNINSPTFSIPSPTASLPSPTRSPRSIPKSISIATVQEKTKIASTPSITRVVTPNGGIGTKKTQKSLLLRKAERAIGLNNAATAKLKKVDKSVAPTVRKPVHKTPIVRKKRQTTGADVLIEREMKEAKLDQTAFEVVLLPPDNTRENIDQNQLEKVDIKETKSGVPKEKVEVRVQERNVDLSSRDVKDISDDFEMDLSDWEDTETIGASEISSELVSGFNLIIEDNPFESKRDEKKVMNPENTGRQLIGKDEMKKVGSNVDTNTLTTPKKSEEMKETTSSNSIDNDQELDAELDRVFDDIKFDDEMSEEE